MQVTIRIKAAHNLVDSEFRNVRGLRRWLKKAAYEALEEATTGELPELYPGFRYDNGPVVREITIGLTRYMDRIAAGAETVAEAQEWKASMEEVVTSGLFELSLQEAYEDILNPVEFRVA